MADGTVRGTFDLDTGPAVRAVQSYRREAARADEQTKRLGNTIDDAFGTKKSGQIEEVASSTTDLADKTNAAQVRVSNSWASMKRDVVKQGKEITAQIDGIIVKMRELGAETARPNINLDGVDDAIAKIELLQLRLDALSRSRSRPNVSLSSSGGGIVSSRGVAGGGGARVARSRGGRVGGGGVPGGRLGKLVIGGATIGAPVIQTLLGSATALAGSAGGAALGAGAVYGSGLAVGGAGALGIASVAKPAVTALKNAMKAQQLYTKAVQDHGRRSVQAAQAQVVLDRTLAGRPGLARTAQQIRFLRSDFSRASAPGQRNITGLIGDAAQITRRAVPQLARDANRSALAARGAGDSQARFLAGSQTQQTLNILTLDFQRQLPTTERTLENVEATFEHIARAALPFFNQANKWGEHWTQNWRASTSNISETRTKIGHLVDDFKTWERLAGSVFRTVKDLGNLGRPAGDSMVVSLTGQFNSWDDWIKRNPAKIRSFFTDSVKSVDSLASGLKGVVGWLNQLATDLRPLLNDFSELLKIGMSLGFVGAPGAAGLAYRVATGGVRGARGGGAGGGASGLGTGIALGAGGAGVAMATGGSRATMLEARRGVTNSGAILMGPATVGPAAVLARRASATSGAARFASIRGAVSRAGGSGLAQGVLGGFRSAAPIVLGLAALQGASTKGSFSDKFQSSISAATFGLVPGPTTAAMAAAQGQQRAGTFIQGLGATTSIHGIDAQVRRLRGRRASALSNSTTTGGGGLFGGHGTLGLFDPGHGGDSGPTSNEAKRNAAAAVVYQRQINALMKEEVGIRKQRRGLLDDRARGSAARFGGGLEDARLAFRHGGQSQEKAAQSTTDLVKKRLSTIGDAGVHTLGDSALRWATALAKKNPKMKKDVDELAKAIEKRYAKMGKNIAIVNGTILTGTKPEWGSIRDAMVGPAEQAKEKLSTDFTAIQQMAVGSLTSMGFSPSQAKQLVKGMEAGGSASSSARTQVNNVQSGLSTPSQEQQHHRTDTPKKNARGGMIPGAGRMDTVPVPGGMAAPGEAWIANDHTLRDLSRASVAMYGKTAQQMIRGETRRHGYATGGKTGGGLQPGVQRVVGALLSKFPGLSVTSTTGGTHAAHSLHYLGEAEDVAGAPALMNTAAAWLGQRYGKSLAEGIHNPNLSIKNGAKVPPSFWGSSTWAEHLNHIHVGVTGSGGARGGFSNGAGGVAGGGVGSVSLKGVGVKQGGLAGVMRNRAGDIYAAGLQSKINAHLNKSGGGGLGNLAGFTGGGTSGANQTLGRKMMMAAGWGADQWPALKALWTQESGWNANAVNPSSGAYGIPQSLGHGHPYNLGDAPAQIAWGLRYIKGRYGSPSAAEGHERQFNWYSRGGRTMDWAGGFANGGSFTTNGPTAFVAGEGHRKRERVTVTPANPQHGNSTAGVHIGAVHVTVEIKGGISGHDDIDSLANVVGEKVAKKIIDAIEQGTAGVVG